MDSRQVAEAEVAAALRRFERRGVERPDLKRSAVGITLVPDPDGLIFLLTRRATTLRGHPGQWALPGGRAEPGESPGETARRELSEELGLTLGPDAELGLLDDYATRSGYVITPVVLWAGPSPLLVPNPDEVGELHRVPVALLDVAPRFLTIPESDQPVIQLPLFDRFVHAPTGAVLHQFAEVVLHGRATRVAHMEQPVFAWR
ncbi:MAG: coenzyme A pyrophosphatase [Pseudonocardia sp. 73-21]|nr:MAG: coenzyme A pyrophosphatase [Pseudonocardia sp. 73-21]